MTCSIGFAAADEYLPPPEAARIKVMAENDRIAKLEEEIAALHAEVAGLRRLVEEFSGLVTMWDLAGDQADLEQWFVQFLKWLRESPIGRARDRFHRGFDLVSEFIRFFDTCTGFHFHVDVSKNRGT